VEGGPQVEPIQTHVVLCTKRNVKLKSSEPKRNGRGKAQGAQGEAQVEEIEEAQPEKGGIPSASYTTTEATRKWHPGGGGGGGGLRHTNRSVRAPL